jgi:cytochrome b
MKNDTDANPASNEASRVFVWDIFIRLFHWTLLALMIALFITGEILDDAIELHAKLGLAVLALILFRLMWGFLGSNYARFGQFVRGPAAVIGYARALFTGQAGFWVGHNPLGGWMVVVLLLTILAQSLLGLFANDDILFEGPLAHLVSKETSDLITGLHEDVFHALLVFIGLHVSAVFGYKIFKGDNLVPPMLTGHKQLPPGTKAEDAQGGSIIRALTLLMISAALVYWLAVK